MIGKENGDYFSKRTGYVLEGKPSADGFEAAKFLVDTGMTPKEAKSYLRRLFSDYETRSRISGKKALEGGAE